jgi:hypothetical protein
MTVTDRLWELLPSVYRQRDAEAPQSGMLQALVQILGREADVVAEDIARLYDNWFIETCDPWVVDYIGDLLGVRILNEVGPATRLPRAYVANTLAYRRRKGTAAVLEQLARDVTEWPAHVVEGITVLATTQYLNHLRPFAVQGISLHDASRLELSPTPFATAAWTASVRVPPHGIGNVPDIGLAVWRLTPFRVERVTARAVSDPADGRYHFDPAGLDIALVNPPQPEASITSLAQEQHVPGFLRRRGLYDELEQVRAGADEEPVFFGVNPVVQVFADTGSGLQEVPVEQLTAADLSDPPASVTTGWRRPADPVTAAVDPVLGRIAFRDGVLPAAVETTYTYAAPGEVGAGPYDRTSDATTDLLQRASFWRAVGAVLPAGGNVSTSVSAAVADWNAAAPGTVGVIAVLDSRSYDGDLALTVPSGSELLIAAGRWPQVETPDPSDPPDPSQLAVTGTRPHLRGNVTVTGAAPPDEDTPRGRLLLDGLLIEGGVSAAAGDLAELQLLHLTVVPNAGAVEVAGNPHVHLTLSSSICGPVTVTGPTAGLTVTRSVVKGDLAAADTDTELDQLTILGALSAQRLTASDCILDGEVTVERKQDGCIRFSYVRDDAATPRRFRCQPDLALNPPAGPAPDPTSVRARVRPVFDSEQYGAPAYGQLADRCAPELTEGSWLRSDMGAFGYLQRPQREKNLGVALDEYLRFGLQAGVIHAT